MRENHGLREKQTTFELHLQITTRLNRFHERAYAMRLLIYMTCTGAGSHVHATAEAQHLNATVMDHTSNADTFGCWVTCSCNS